MKISYRIAKEVVRLVKEHVERFTNSQRKDRKLRPVKVWSLQKKRSLNKDRNMRSKHYSSQEALKG